MNDDHTSPARPSPSDKTVFGSDSGSAVESATLSALFPSLPRPWQEMWAAVELSLARMEQWRNTDEEINITGFCLDVYGFFVTCYHLGEHIKLDPHAEVSAADVTQVLATDPLRVAEAMTNTFKHHTRHPDRTEARIATVSGGPPATVTLEWQDRSLDGLVIAKQAMQAWKELFAAQGLHP